MGAPRLADGQAGFLSRLNVDIKEMTMTRSFAVLCLSAWCAFALAAEPHPVVTYSKKANFEDVRDDLKTAIEGKGLVIDFHSFVNKMLERTGKDLGSARDRKSVV